MSRSIAPNYPSLCIFAFCILLTVFFSACSGSSTQQSGGSSTGGISFQLVWQQPSSSAKKLTPSANACVDHAIDTIAATVSNGTTTVTASWPCSEHQGFIFGVPAGTNYTLQINGISSGPTTTTWSGQATGITVITNETTTIGPIVMSYIGTDTTDPTATSIGPNSSPPSTTNVPITDRINMTFSEPMAISTITSTNITLINSSDMSAVAGLVSYVGNTAAFIPSANLAYDTQYVLQVVSCVTGSCITDTAGNPLASNYTFTFTTEIAPSAAPTTPSGVTATPGNGQVTLDWLATNGSTSYNVYYSLTSGITGTKIPDARAPFVHLNLSNGTIYYYIVTAVNSFGESPASAEVNATPVTPAGNPNVPSPPASLAATPGFSQGISQNVITWPAVTGATAYSLYWSTTPITPDITAADNVIRYIACNTGTCSFVHTPLTGGQTYFYIVTATNSYGESAGSPQAAATALTGSSGGTGGSGF